MLDRVLEFAGRLMLAGWIVYAALWLAVQVMTALVRS